MAPTTSTSPNGNETFNTASCTAAPTALRPAHRHHRHRQSTKPCHCPLSTVSAISHGATIRLRSYYYSTGHFAGHDKKLLFNYKDAHSSNYPSDSLLQYYASQIKTKNPTTKARPTSSFFLQCSIAHGYLVDDDFFVSCTGGRSVAALPRPVRETSNLDGAHRRNSTCQRCRRRLSAIDWHTATST